MLVAQMSDEHATDFSRAYVAMKRPHAEREKFETVCLTDWEHDIVAVCRDASVLAATCRGAGSVGWYTVLDNWHRHRGRAFVRANE